MMSASVLGLAAMHGSARAQQAPAKAPDDSATLQEIVVTAQRHSQNLLSVPLSISAATGDQLNKVGIRDLTSLQFTTPGYVPSNSSGYTQIYVRGIGNSIFVGADPSVATFIDDVPRIYGSMVNNLVDVDRVEILKGAQGGLYGRNATGGVVNIITTQPSLDSYHGNGRVEYGQKNTLQASVYENIPLNKMMAWSFAIERDQHDPYIKNISSSAPYTAAMFPDGAYRFGAGGAIVPLTPQGAAAFFNSGVRVPKGVDNQDFWAVDSKLLIKPTDNFKVTIAGDYSRKHDSDGNQIYNPETGYLQGFLGGLFSSFGINAQLPAGFANGSDGKFTTARGIDAYTWLEDYGGSVTAVWNAPHVDVTSITAYRAQQTDFYEDLAAAPVPAVDVYVNNRKWFLYQEFRAVSTDTGPFHYLAGATYLSNNFHGENHSITLAPLYTTPVTHVDNPVRNWSVYGQLGYDFTDALNLTVSGRYVHETNSAMFTTPVVDSASIKETKFLPSATLSYKLAGGGNIYARWADGFKAGGVNPIAPPSVFKVDGVLQPGSIFAPETVKTYEVGYRAPLFGHTVQLTTAAFYNDYKNLQVSAHADAEHADISLAIVNAGSARTYGVEESVVWKATRAVTLGMNAGYLNAKYKTFAVPPGGILLPFDVSGTTMPNSPKWQLSFNGDLDQPINDQYRLVGTVLVSHLSSMNFLQSALPGVLPEPVQPGYWLTNLRIGVRTTDDKYGLAIFANNLFDEGYVTYGSSNVLGNQLTWGNPRIIGAEVTAKW